jgi:DNA-binding Xre family transcriptional regulator
MKWNVRQVMASRGIFQTSELLPLLEERGIHLTRQYVHRLVTTAPQRINTDLLAALCDILDCNAADLLHLEVNETRAALPKAVGERGPGIGDLRPIRARLRRPGDQT